MHESVKKIEKFGKVSYCLSNNSIELFVTEESGNMAPVKFFSDSHTPVQPYYINPWYNEAYQNDIKLLESLRGDFFCLPFGANNTFDGESHPIHGETANNLWNFTLAETKGNITALILSMDTKARPGEVRKKIFLKDGHQVVYVQHEIRGFAGKTPLGHHATLQGSSEPLAIDTSAIQFGITGYHNPNHYEQAEYYSLASEAKFESLQKVPTIWKNPEFVDCSQFGTREGFIDILQIFYASHTGPVWTAVTNCADGYIWFSLKDPKILPSTVMWTEHYGRHAEPWNGRNYCIGLEDVCSYAAAGLAESVVENKASKEGVKTYHDITGEEPFFVNYIEGVSRIPNNFGRVADITCNDAGLVITSTTGAVVEVSVDHTFLNQGPAVWDHKNP